MVHYGYEPFEDGSRVALNLATSYAIVKVGEKKNNYSTCIWLTPKMAETIIGPITELFKRITINKIKNS
ncbi:4963_t:CDS:2 [Diversispora eburnea]|uniref:4963_t:CDS:1 n=1 Tax=Diversispora eburnea TaxID=1213867 RepID=A0A9N8VC79_9GLOM|nr:4963_t:CDS:2 [Diversispora eburnea]